MAGIRTALTDRLGIEAPIVQAPIGPCAGPELAAPVSGAGGLGMLSVTWQAVELIDRHVARTRELTDRPFGVNVILEWDQHARVEACLAAGVGVVSLFLSGNFGCGSRASRVELIDGLLGTSLALPLLIQLPSASITRGWPAWLNSFHTG